MADRVDQVDEKQRSHHRGVRIEAVAGKRIDEYERICANRRRRHKKRLAVQRAILVAGAASRK